MDCLTRWRSWIRPLVVSVYFILVVVALPLMVWQLNINDTGIYVQAWFIGGVFVVMAVPISVWGVLQHLIHYTQPFLQRHIIRIMWMVPIYAVNAWFALRFPGTAIYLDTMRECYEAYVIYNFMSYLLGYLRSEYADLEGELAAKSQVEHLIPFCWFPHWTMGNQFLQRCKHGVLQYTVVRPVTTIIALCCELGGVYEEGDFNFSSAWSYLVIINNISQVWALYCLVLFYKATKEELAPLKPLSKFMCVKAVVFMSFWQGVLIAVLVKLNVINEKNAWEFKTVKGMATGLQDFCICVEMFLAAIAHYFSFSHEPYMDPSLGSTNCCTSFMSMWDVSDVRDDVVEHVRTVGKTVHRKVLRPVIRPGYARISGNERTPLLRESPATNINSITSTTYQASDANLLSPSAPPTTSTATADVHSNDIRDVASDGSQTDLIESGAFQRKSITASMNNYVQFSSSVESMDRTPYQTDQNADRASIGSSNSRTKAKTTDQRTEKEEGAVGGQQVVPPTADGEEDSRRGPTGASSGWGDNVNVLKDGNVKV